MAVTDIFDDLTEQTLLINQHGSIVYANSSAQTLVYGDTLKQCGLITLNTILESMIYSHETAAQQFHALQDNHVKYDVTISRFYSLYAVSFQSVQWLKPQPEHEQGRYKPAIDDADLRRQLHQVMAFFETILPTLNRYKNSHDHQQLHDYQLSIKRDIQAYHLMMAEISLNAVATHHSVGIIDEESTLTPYKKYPDPSSGQCLKRPLLKLVK